MTKTFLVADPHFGHKGMCHFTSNDGSPLRPWDTPDEMDEALIDNWNSVVSEEDRVYVLGDLVMNRRCIKTVGRCNGRKVLIKGNHDIFKLKDYTPYFEDIRSYKVGMYKDKGRYILSHIPIHPDCLTGYNWNIHGHLHSNSLKDDRYLCVSLEHTNFKPIELEAAMKIILRRSNNA